MGDSGYPISKWLLAPYRSPKSSIPRNAVFNERISSARVVIEHTNGVLKMRWSSLQGLRHQIREKHHVQNVVDWIRCCCTLHNIMAELKDGWDYLPQDLEEPQPDAGVGRWNRVQAEGEHLRNRVQAFMEDQDAP